MGLSALSAIWTFSFAKYALASIIISIRQHPGPRQLTQKRVTT